ncbi:ferrous iron transport protein B [Enemella sp. A6]|uniref:ferrous iron transport protein B n=1 Tax=Enemella sp. A6 TaxID=3440152 RepID=UPI003EBD07EA
MTELRARSVATVSCHAAATSGGAGPDAPVIAFAGLPNVGKSTLFNAVTRSRVTTGNWPGTTVDVARGRWKVLLPGCECEHFDGACDCPERDCVAAGCPEPRSTAWTVVDLPGAYSLDAHSPDEALARDLIVTEAPDAVVAVVDSANLTRGLYLVSELRERSLKVVVALTMGDVAERRGVRINAETLAAELGCPVVPIDPRRRTGLLELAQVVGETLRLPVPLARIRAPFDAEDELAEADERFGWIDQVVERSTEAGEARQNWSDRIDRIATAPLWGGLLFLAVMFVVFQITTTVAAPLQDFLDGLFTGPVSEGASGLLQSVGLGGTWLEGLIVNGLIAGVGMLLTFVPLMALMFLLLALLEDSGYLARAAVVTDRVMRALGLPGRAFLPLIVGFGCNVPAISATRILPNAQHRLLTALLVPLTACSARLTVYVMLGTIFFGKWAGVVVFSMYLTSILLVVGLGLLLRRTLWRTMGADPLVIDLPPYQRPTARLTAAVTWLRLKGFLQTAAGIIVATVCVVWVLQSIPVRGDQGFAEVPVEDSAYAVAAQTVAPVFTPAGFDTWQTVSALVVGFVAKEAVISSWAQTYAVEETEEADSPLGQKIMSAFEESSGGHPLPAVMAFLVFLVAYTPCVATLAAQWREIGPKWTLFGIAVQMAMAWVLAVAVFQIGRLFW